MPAPNVYLPISGTIVEVGGTGSHAFTAVLLCGVANGSSIVPVAVSGNGALITN